MRYRSTKRSPKFHVFTAVFACFRGSAVGAGSIAARIGTMSAPFILYLQQSFAWFPNAFFGVLSFVAGFLALKLPETKDCGILETIEEAELFYRDSHFSKCVSDKLFQLYHQ